MGDLGVRVFFVLSGFLITSLLVRELSSSGSIDLKRFYLRRTLRIFPAFYTFVIALIVLDALGLAPIRPGDAAAAFGYIGDYHRISTSTLFHSWSLAVEEQFYLLWPAALLLVGLRRAIFVPVAVVLTCPLIRLIELIFANRYGFAPFALDYHYRFDTQADALAMGCLLALFREKAHRAAWYWRLLASPWLVLAPLSALAISDLQPWQHPALLPFYTVPGFTIMNVAIALTLDRAITYPRGRVTRVLNWRPLVFLGVLSYSIYLWQEIFLRPQRPEWYTRLPLALPLLGVCVVASYYGVERPFLRLRKWRERDRSRALERPETEQIPVIA